VKISVTMGAEHYIGTACYLCGQHITEDELTDLVGGNQHRLVHGHCYYTHEADDVWRTRPQRFARPAEDADDAD
jgi:hypothetical protein